VSSPIIHRVGVDCDLDRRLTRLLFLVASLSRLWSAEPLGESDSGGDCEIRPPLYLVESDGVSEMLLSVRFRLMVCLLPESLEGNGSEDVAPVNGLLSDVVDDQDEERRCEMSCSLSKSCASMSAALNAGGFDGGSPQSEIEFLGLLWMLPFNESTLADEV